MTDSIIYIIQRTEYSKPPGVPYVVSMCDSLATAEATTWTYRAFRTRAEMLTDPHLARAYWAWERGDDEVGRRERKAMNQAVAAGIENTSLAEAEAGLRAAGLTFPPRLRLVTEEEEASGSE